MDNLRLKIQKLFELMGFNEPTVSCDIDGKKIAIFVNEGDSVKTGQPLAAIEAMKMENVLQSACDGRVEAIYVAKGERVNLDQPLIKIE